MTDPIRQSPPPKRRGCFFYGCLTSIVLLLIVGVLAFLAVRWVNGQINAYTDTAPRELPKVEMPEADLKSLQERVRSFGDALKEGKPIGPLVLTELEINALLLNAPNMNLSDKVYVSLEGDAVKGQVSIPLDKLPFLKGRYFNGTATFKVSVANGQLIVNLQEAEVKGKQVPERVMSKVRMENFAKEFNNDPKKAETINKLESIGIEDSKVTVKARARE